MKLLPACVSGIFLLFRACTLNLPFRDAFSVLSPVRFYGFRLITLFVWGTVSALLLCSVQIAASLSLLRSFQTTAFLSRLFFKAAGSVSLLCSFLPCPILFVFSYPVVPFPGQNRPPRGKSARRPVFDCGGSFARRFFGPGSSFPFPGSDLLFPVFCISAASVPLPCRILPASPG